MTKMTLSKKKFDMQNGIKFWLIVLINFCNWSRIVGSCCKVRFLYLVFLLILLFLFILYGCVNTWEDKWSRAYKYVVFDWSTARVRTCHASFQLSLSHRPIHFMIANYSGEKIFTWKILFQKGKILFFNVISWNKVSFKYYSWWLFVFQMLFFHHFFFSFWIMASFWIFSVIL